MLWDAFGGSLGVRLLWEVISHSMRQSLDAFGKALACSPTPGVAFLWNRFGAGRIRTDRAGAEQKGLNRNAPGRAGPDRIGRSRVESHRPGRDRTVLKRIGPSRIGSDQIGF